MIRNAITILAILMIFGTSYAQNYVRTKISRNDAGTLINETTNYIDGIGRSSQVVSKGITPTGKDLVSLQEYNDMGRPVKQWLPVISAGNGAYVVPSTLKATQSIYGSDARHFSETIYEASSVGRVLETYGAGQTWFQNGRSVKTAIYANNSTDSLSAICYTLTGTVPNMQLVKVGNYSSNELMVSRTLDEDGRSSFTFKNKNGQLIMKRKTNITAGNQKEFLDTYYVNDLSGNLSYVLTPEVGNSLPVGTISDDNDILKKHAYVYKYKWRDLCTNKRLPGGAWEYYVFDNFSRVVMSQDGNLREKNQWLYNVYDNHNRIIGKSTVSSTAAQSDLQYGFRSRSNYFPYTADNAKNLFVPAVVESSAPQDSLYYAVYGNNHFTIEARMEDLLVDPYLRLAVNTDWLNHWFFDGMSQQDKENFIADAQITYNSQISSGYKSLYFQNDFIVNPDFYSDTDYNNPNITYYYVPMDYFNDILEVIHLAPFAFEFVWGDPVFDHTIPGLGGPKFRHLDANIPVSLAFSPVTGVVSSGDLAVIKEGLLSYERIKILDQGSTSSYVEKAYYYDNKARMIQTVEKNPSGTSRISYKYDFVGNLLTEIESQSVAGINTDIKTDFTYDHANRVSTEKVYVNSAEQASLAYTYDELGRLSNKQYAKGSWSTTESLNYNLRSWLTEKSNPYFSMQLNYSDVFNTGSTKLYGGGISEMTWQHSGGSNNMYSFNYDRADRLTGTTQYVASGGNWVSAPGHYVESGITYDKNGNILSLQRSAGGVTVDNLSYTYDGNRLSALDESVASAGTGDIFVRGGAAQGTYGYDVNGNMVADNRKGLTYGYNLLNLINNVKQGSTTKASYRWLANGNKFSVRDGAGTNGMDYVGSIVYMKQGSTTTVDMIQFSSGVIKNQGSSYMVNYFINDHLGSTRAVVTGTGVLIEQNDYYSFGARHKRSDYLASDNKYKYNGKELQSVGDVGFLDYGARMYDTEIGRWHSVDPLAELDRARSSYNYARNNPLRFIDPDGMFWGDFLDEKGRMIGTDGKSDGKVYVMKTTQKKFDSGAPSAGITKDQADATTKFITDNSGNTAAFEANNIAYSNSVEIEGRASTRQAMVDIVNQDDGRGGSSEANNREYGGAIKSDGSGVVEQATPGPVANPLTDPNAHIDLPAYETRSTFHSHPSGTRFVTSSSSNNSSGSSSAIGGESSSGYFLNAPSNKGGDVGNSRSKINYVFSRGNGTVYIYNNTGVIATMPQKYFVTPNQKKR